jgi:hypothetical protein
LPTGLAGDLACDDGDERALVRTDLLDQVEQLRARVALDVELDPASGQGARNVAHIGGRDVTAISPRVHRDAGRAGGDARQENGRRASSAASPPC